MTNISCTATGLLVAIIPTRESNNKNFIVSKFWIITLSFILFASCQVKENPITEELLFLKKDVLSNKQLDSLLIKNEIPKSEWGFHKSDSIDGVYIPYNLYDCFNQIDSLFPDSIKLEIFSGQTHFGFGLWMRNNWGLWQESRLWLYFHDKGVSHPDHISSLITSMYYRKITNAELSFQKDLQVIKESEAERKKSKQKEKDRVIAISSLVKIADSINFQMPIDLKSKRTYLYGYPSLNLSSQDEFRDSMLIIRGIVTDKIYPGTDSLAVFHIRITALSQLGIEILDTKKNIGDQIKLLADYLYLLD